jgi:DNA-binding IscR family transcriptional regulator
VRSPDDITLGEVITVIEGPADSSLGTTVTSDSPAARVLTETWREITEVEQQMLYSLNFAELIDRARQQSEHMYYI